MMNFSSLPPQQEQHFVVFEQYRANSQSQALLGGVIAGAFIFIAAAGIYFGVTPERKDLTKDMNMSNLSKKKSVDAPAPTPAPAAAPTPAPAAAPSEAPPAAAPAAAAPAAAPASK
jgi:hypothetical protein